MRERDYAYEALAEVTDAHTEANRGELNVALKQIRQQCDLDGYELSLEIHTRAAQYRRVMGDALLTPTALAKHWVRVAAESGRTRGLTNQESKVGEACQTCGGDRFVVVGTRPAIQTVWMKERGISPAEDAAFEEVAGCPDCNPNQVTMRRWDGTLIATPDAARVRERMRR